MSIITSNGVDTFVALNDDTTVNGRGGNDVINGAGGEDSLKGGTGDDYIKGGTMDDTIAGGSGDDTVVGGSGDDVLIGGLGNDKLVGGTGDDILQGGAGNNKFFGGEGADKFIFTADSTGFNKVFDFEMGIDTLEFKNVEVSSYDETDAGLVVELDTGGTLLLKGLDADDGFDLFGF
ncbi:calcium-binding protein [Salipiger mangrovisoli]|uniref:Calcium-binding protein n=1 Tax=Salipiger mangrovisoli TaxID=2865933 RepID=A0ABR9X0P0_9RHOB|nr:calcium-binding protein [Salipiger mangrovisoli]MBE9637057.1 calcium-binding protein [Salipiger mangrovisoli]